VACNCILQQGRSVVDRAPRGGDETAAAHHVGEHPLAPEPCRVRLPLGNDADRVVEPPELEQRLGVVGDPPALARLPPPEPRRRPLGLVEPSRRFTRIAALQCNEAERPEMHGRVQPDLLLPELQRQLRVRAGELEPAAMGRDHRRRQMVPRHVEAVLDADVERAGSAVGRMVPAAAPQLDPGEVVERAGSPQLVAFAPLVIGRFEQRTAGADVPARVEHVRQRVDRVPQQLGVAGGSGELVRPRGMRRGVGVAHRAPEEREHRERAHPQPVVVEPLGQLQRRARMLERTVESPFEAHGDREPAVDRRLEGRTRDRLVQRLLEQRDVPVQPVELGEQNESLGP
jgi:hypothetical protein